jgi:hydroxymethylpyrimidine pyrophosphatase-like HAD family hydrolase
VILENGEPCPDWAATVLNGASYEQARPVLEPVFTRPWVRKIRSAEDRFLYAVFEPAEVTPDWFAELEDAAGGLGWVLSVQGRKAYTIPAGLTKEAAIAEIARRTGSETVAAAGDSLLDRGMLTAANIAIRPAHGELHDQAWTCPGLVVTERAGGGAGEEIVDWFSTLSA